MGWCDEGRSHCVTALLCTVGVLCDMGTGGGQHNAVGCRAPQSPPCFLWSPLGLDAVPPSLGARGRSCCLSSVGMHECVPNPRSHARLTLQPLTAPHLLPAQSPAAPLLPSSAPFLPMDPRWVCATLKPSRATVMGTAHRGDVAWALPPTQIQCHGAL